MDILISKSSPLPIYEQITSQIKEKIIKGELKDDEMLPSMRGLARSLKISVITIQRAYEDLQRDGFVVSVSGKGTFVKKQNTESIVKEKLKEIEKYLEDAVSTAKIYNISLDKLKEILDVFYGHD